MGRAPWWDAIGSRALLTEEGARARDRLADAARAGDWPVVFSIVENQPEPRQVEWVNSVRLDGSSGYTPLHQAAWHGANVEIVDRLVGHGQTAGAGAVDRAAITGVVVPDARHGRRVLLPPTRRGAGRAELVSGGRRLRSATPD